MMVEISQTYADVTNIQPRTRKDINIPTSTRETRKATTPTITDPVTVLRQKAEGPIKEYTQQKIGKKRKKRTYDPVEFVETPNGYKLLYKGTYTRRRGKDYYSKGVYVKQELSYNKAGQLLRREDFSIDRDTRTIYLRREKNYNPSTGEVNVRTNVRPEVLRRAPPEPEPRKPTPYDVSDEAGKIWRSSNVEFLKSKTGVDVTKLREGTEVIRDKATGQVYYARKETIGGKEVLVGVGKPGEKVRVSEVRKESREREREQRLSKGTERNVVLPTDLSLKALQERGTQVPIIEGAGTLGDNITVQPEGTTPSFYKQSIDPRTGRTPGTFTEDLTPKRFGSEKRSDLASVARAKGEFREAGKQELLAFTTGVFEFGKELVTNPVGFITAPFLKPKETIEGFKQQALINPAGLAGQLVAGAGLSKGVSKAVGKVRGRVAKKKAAEALEQSRTEGIEVVYDDIGGFVEKTTTGQAKVGNKIFDIRAGSKETFGVSGEPGLVTQRAKTALAILQEATGETKAPFTAGEGRFAFEIGKKGKVVVKGTGETGLAGQNIGDIDVYTRTAEAQISNLKGTKKSVEIGVLQEQLGTKTESLVEGSSTVLSEKGLQQKGLVIESELVKSKEFTPAFGEEISSGTPTRAPSAYDIIGGEPRTVTRTRFVTRDITEPLTLKFSEQPVGKVNIPERTSINPEAIRKAAQAIEAERKRVARLNELVPSDTSVLVQEAKPTKPTQGLKLSTAEKNIISESLGEYVETTSPQLITPIPVPTTKTTEEETVRRVDVKNVVDVKDVVEPSTREETLTRTRITPKYDLVSVEKLSTVTRQEPLLDTRTATETKLAQEQTPAQQTVQRLVPRQTTAQRTTTQLMPKSAAPPPFAPLVAPVSPWPKRKTRGGLYSVLVRKKGLFETVGEGLDLGEAFGKGRGIVEQTAAASFKVIDPTGRTPTVSRARQFLTASFRQSKVESGVWVQKREKRIKTAGEKKEITAKGLFALKKRRWV